MQDNYYITYSNYFRIENEIFAFRKKKLFNITKIPIYKPLQLKDNIQGYWINRVFYSLLKIKEMLINENKIVDVSELQWYEQVQLDECFNLTK